MGSGKVRTENATEKLAMKRSPKKSH